MANCGKFPFIFAGPDLDRLASYRRDRDWLSTCLSAPETRFIPVCGEDNLIVEHGPAPLLLDSDQVRCLLPQVRCTVLMGRYRNHTCFALGLPSEVGLPTNHITRTNLRPQFAMLEYDMLALLGYARAMVHWHALNRYCGRCGVRTNTQNAGHELHCSCCNSTNYPRVNPAIIVLVTHSDRCLLGHQVHWPDNRYSTVAGFVEPGESLEATVRREVWEETNIRVATMHYAASQPWPYPGSLMLGFRATGESTDIHCNDGELADARWFSRADIIQGLQSQTLTLPTQQSISFWLIREWFEEAGAISLESYLPVDMHPVRS